MDAVPDYRFDGRVAVVTGAGRGLGRSHSLLLAALGAKVVVNDLGGSKEGVGSDVGPAMEVVEEIRVAGGTAVADTHDVGTEEGCKAIVQTAIDQFGRIDVVVNNAGISRFATFPEADGDNLDRTLDVHVRGTWHTTRAAWPHFEAQGYGRVITTTSTGMLGLPNNLAYATAKGALIGFTRSLAIAAAPKGILVNCIAPNAVTRPSSAGSAPNITTSATMDPVRLEAMDTSLVSPMVAYLAHESCTVNGEILVAGARRFGQWFMGFTEGWLDTEEERPSVAAIADHWAEITDREGYSVPADLWDWSKRFMRQLA